MGGCFRNRCVVCIFDDRDDEDSELVSFCILSVRLLTMFCCCGVWGGMAVGGMVVYFTDEELDVGSEALEKLAESKEVMIKCHSIVLCSVGRVSWTLWFMMSVA